jgi:hypothetical protein
VQKAMGRRRGHARRLRVEGGEHEPGRAGGAEPDIEDDAPGMVDVEPDRERAGGAQNLNGAQKKTSPWMVADGGCGRAGAQGQQDADEHGERRAACVHARKRRDAGDEGVTAHDLKQQERELEVQQRTRELDQKTRLDTGLHRGATFLAELRLRLRGRERSGGRWRPWR